MTGSSSIALAWSAVLGSTAAAVGGGVFALDAIESPPAIWERLGTAGLVVVAMVIALRWAVNEMRRQNDAASAIISTKDAVIAHLTQEMYASMKSASDQLITEVRSLAAGRVENTAALKDLTKAIEQNRTVCQFIVDRRQP